MIPLTEEKTAASSFIESPLDEARHYARKGSYDEASKVLAQAASEAQQPCEKVDLFDLQGRILAQQGLYMEAEKYWVKALALDPSNAVCAAALERIRSRRRPVGLSRILMPIMIAVVVPVLLIYQTHTYTAGYEKLKEAFVNDVSAIKSDLHEMDERLSAGEERLKSHVYQLIQPMQRLQGELNDAGRRREKHLIVLQAGLDRHMTQAAEANEEIVNFITARLAAMASEAADRHKSTLASVSALARAQTNGKKRFTELVDRMAALEAAIIQQFIALNTQMEQAFKRVAHASDIDILRQNMGHLHQQLERLNDASDESGRSRK